MDLTNFPPQVSLLHVSNAVYFVEDLKSLRRANGSTHILPGLTKLLRGYTMTLTKLPKNVNEELDTLCFCVSTIYESMDIESISPYLA